MIVGKDNVHCWSLFQFSLKNRVETVSEVQPLLIFGLNSHSTGIPSDYHLLIERGDLRF